MTLNDVGSPAKAATLRLLMPGREQRSIGVLLLDLDTGTLYSRVTSNWEGYDDDDVELFRALEAHINEQARQAGGRVVFEHLTDTLSNALLLVDERDLRVLDFRAQLKRLFTELVEK